MMNCQFVNSRFGPYVDGELDGSEMLRVRRHIHSCPQCSHELEDYRRVKRLISSLPQRRPTKEFESSLLRKVRFEHRRSLTEVRTPWGIKKMFGWGITFSLAAVAAFALFQTMLQDDMRAANSNAGNDMDELLYEQDYYRARDPFSGSSVPVVVDKESLSR